MEKIKKIWGEKVGNGYYDLRAGLYEQKPFGKYFSFDTGIAAFKDTFKNEFDSLVDFYRDLKKGIQLDKGLSRFKNADKFTDKMIGNDHTTTDMVIKKKYSPSKPAKSSYDEHRAKYQDSKDALFTIFRWRGL